MKKTTIIALLLATTSMSAFAQEETSTFKRNTAYVGLGGFLYTYSLNYDRVFNPEGYFKWSLSAGIGYDQERYDFSSSRSRTYGVPLGIYGLTGNRNSHIEAAVSLEPGLVNYQQGNTSSYSSNSIDNGTYFTGILSAGIGYRYQRPTGGLFFAVRSLWFMQGYYGWRTDNKLRNPGDYYKNFGGFPNLTLSLGYTFR